MAEDGGDLAAIIADAAINASDRADREGGDPVVRGNQPRTKFAPGTLHPLGEPRTPPAEAPEVKPIYAFFNQSTFSTTYTVAATPDPVGYHWVLIPDPHDSLGCENGGQLTSADATFVYYHGSDQCDHTVYQDGNYGHQATIEVILTFPGGQVCSERIFGTTTGYSESPRPDSEPVAKPCVAIGTG
jgi:hypothetical protein